MRSFRPALLTCVLLAAPAAAQAPATGPEPGPAFVGGDGALVHAFYDARSPVVAELEADWPVEVVEVLAPWARVQVPGGLDVWVHGDYLEVGDDVVARVTARAVRARPLPSTGPESPPLGTLKRDERVVLVGREGDWWQVRAPERIGGWVELETLEFPADGRRPPDWERRWEETAKARPPKELPPVPPVPEPTPEPTPTPEPPETGDEDDPLEELLETLPAFADEEEPARRAFPSEEIALDPLLWVGFAAKALEEYRDELAADFTRWDERRTIALEAAFADVLWYAANPRILDRARRGLAGVDALRRSYGAWLAGEERRLRGIGEDESADAMAARLRRLDRTWGLTPDGEALVVGWVEARPGVHESWPYEVVRNGMRARAQDPRGGVHLGDFVGQEVVIRGRWRDRDDAPGGRVLLVEDIKALPPSIPR